jgi:CheY-like chemotaxis protein
VKTLLLADDSVTVQRVIELTFADEGMRVVAVGDGRQAIERLATERPDVVLADVGMPECDGYELAAHVKRDPALSHIPVVLMTGAFDQLDEGRAREAGYDGVIAKPFEPQMVISLVRRLLAGEPGPIVSDSGVGPAEGASSPPGPIALGHPFDTTELAGASSSVDDYFERLDEALASSRGRLPAPPHQASFQPPAEPQAAAARDAREPEGPVGRRPSDRPLPTIAEAFSLLLAEELGERPADWPGASVAWDEALVDELARRVGERLGERVLREIIAREVLPLAERLVLEEIGRLKRQP